MYICIYIYVCVYTHATIHMCAYIYLHTYDTHTWMHKYVNVLPAVQDTHDSLLADRQNPLKHRCIVTGLHPSLSAALGF